MTLRAVIKNRNDLVMGKNLTTPKIERWLALHSGEFVLDAANAKLMLEVLQYKGRVRKGSFSASSLARCPRAQMFTFIGVPQAMAFDPIGSLRMIDGRVKHLTMQMIALQAGAISRIEVPINVPKWKFKGSLDGDHADYGFELKTTQAFSYYVSKGPPYNHISQIHGYFIGRPDLERFSLVYWDTRSREMKEFVIDRQHHMIAVARQLLDELNTHAANQTLPEVLDECKSGKSKTYRDCAYSHICLSTPGWDEAESYVSGTSNSRGNDQKVPGRRRNRPQSNDSRTRSVPVRIVRKKASP